MNKTYRQLYNELADQLGVLQKQADENKDKQYELSDKISALIEAVVMEEQMLSKGTWTIESQHYGPGHFTLTCQQTSKDMRELSKIAETNYHCQCKLEGVTLRFDDYRISLSFSPKSPITPLAFVQKHGMKLDSSNLIEDVSRAKEKLRELEEIVRAFNP